MILAIAIIIIFCFGGVVFFGAPYLPTLRPQAITALDLLDLEPGQTVLELGCGDGKVLKMAAERGLRAVGIELNPFLALIAWLRTRRYGDAVMVSCGNFWHESWPICDGVYVFLLPRYMDQLDVKMKQYGGKLVSIAFVMPDKKPTKIQNGVYLYSYTNKISLAQNITGEVT